jgi:hypothetical protein
VTLVWTPGYDDGSTYTPGRLVLKKEFIPESYMYEFPSQYPIWTPANITTALWLDAADASTVTTVSGAVSQWNDKSGNGRNAVQATSTDRPAYTANELNGKSVLTLDGTNDFMTVANADALNAQISPSTVAVVYKKSAGFRVMQKKDGLGIENTAWFFDDASVLSVAGGFTTSYATNQNSWQIDIGTWDNSTSKHWRNGSKLTATSVTGGSLVSGEIDPTNTPVLNTDALYIGRRLNPAGTTGIMTGQIAGILICNAVLTDVDRQKLEGYYAHQFALTANLPVGHPYKTVGPTP